MKTLTEMEQKLIKDFNQILAEKNVNGNSRDALSTADFEKMSNQELELFLETHKDPQPDSPEFIRDLQDKSKQLETAV
jgi:hypothetical protein